MHLCFKYIYSHMNRIKLEDPISLNYEAIEHEKFQLPKNVIITQFKDTLLCESTFGSYNILVCHLNELKFG